MQGCVRNEAGASNLRRAVSQADTTMGTLEGAVQGQEHTPAILKKETPV